MLRTILLVAGVSTVLLAAPAWSQAPANADSLRRDSLARFSLAPIEVNVTRSAERTTRLPYAVQAVTAEEIGPGRARLGLDEALATIPGVIAANRQNYSLDQTISIRGFGARSAFGVRGLKVMLDGIPQTLPDGQGQLTNVDLDDVQRVEVLRGSASSLYGNAAGGVINLSTGDARPSRISPVMSVVGGAYGLRKYRAAVDLPVGPGSLAVSGVRTTTDGYRIHSNADLRQGRARFTIPLAGNELMVVAQVADDPVIKDPGALTAVGLESNGRAANPLSVTNDARKDVGQTQVGVTLSRRAPNGASASFTGFGLRRFLSNPTTAAYIHLSRWAYGTRGSASIPVRVGSRPAMLAAGVDAQWQRDDRINQNVQRTALTRDQLERVMEVGPFVQGTIDPAAGVTFNAGGRYDRVRFAVDDQFPSDGDDSGVRIMSALSGSVGLAWHSHDWAAPYANVSTSFETPTTTELANRPTGPGGFNPVLEPQKTVSYELGLKGFGRVAGLGDGVRVDYSLALYRANLRGELIPFETPGDMGRRFFQNSGSSRHSGVEAGLGIRAGGFSVHGGYTYSRHRFVEFRTALQSFDGLEEPGVPAHYLRGVATWRIAGVAWVSAEETMSSAFVVNDANSAWNGGWATTALRAGADMRVAGWSLSPFAGLSNVFDKNYAGSVQVNAANGRYYEPAPRRNLYLGAELRR